MSSVVDLHLCIPVLKRYDLLKKLITSLQESTAMPHTIHVIDNGRQAERLAIALAEATVPVDIFVPDVAMGVAESWNWFLANVPEERVISNDDITFPPTCLEEMLKLPHPFVSVVPGRAFSCFLLRDVAVEEVGFFDESISPGYAYFEDCDYEFRMAMTEDVRVIYAPVAANHFESGSLDGTPDHHKRFLNAQTNFLNKWGRLPEGVAKQL